MRQRTQAILESSKGSSLSTIGSYREKRELDIAIDFFMWRYNAAKAPGHVTLKQRQWPWYPDGTVECRMKFNRGYEMLRQLYDKPLDTSSSTSTSPCPWTLGARKRKYIESSDSPKRPKKRRWGGLDDGNDNPGQDEPSRRPSWFRSSAECPPVFD
ncbi:hypothetical protein NW756_007080 [Fusarium oxysporum]|nr:hypothetical protein NW753_001695 [Fusarium oxysporum]KAJ4088683.1 hypothetical protein NW756_007080 [Fusarium oxysporum]